MPLSPLEYLRHILDETEYLMSEKKNLNKAQFLQDVTLKRAFVRSLEIIGEAAKKVPQELRKEYPDVEWKSAQHCWCAFHRCAGFTVSSIVHLWRQKR